MLFAWRLARLSTPWVGRTIMTGAILLGFGYMFIVPMYEVGLIRSYSPPAAADPEAATWLAWRIVKTAVMNLGWLFFSLGLGFHSGLFRLPRCAAKPAPALPVSEFVA